MEAFEGVVKRIVNALNGAKVEYLLTEALAASHYGLPRTTADVDIIVKVSAKNLHSWLLPALKLAGLKVEEEKIKVALRSGYNVVSFEDSISPFTVDVIFFRKTLRKRPGSILGLPTFYQTPEDLILAKLRMVKATVPKDRTLKDVDDIKTVLRFSEVDVEAVKREALKNSTLPILEKIIGELDSLDKQYF